MKGMLRLTRGVHGFERVADEALGSADRARNIEAPIEVSEILRGLERLLKRGLGKPERRSEALQLPRIGLLHCGIIALTCRKAAIVRRRSNPSVGYPRSVSTRRTR